MRRAKSFALPLSVAASLGLGLLLGCAVEPTPTEIQPAEAVEPDIEDVLAQADHAYQAEDYERARQLYGALSQQPEALSEERQELVQTRLARAESILHQRGLAREATVARAETVAEVQKAVPEEPAEEPAMAAPEEPTEVAKPEPAAEAEAPPAVPEVSVGEAPRVLAAVEELCAEGKFEEAAPQLMALDKVRGEMSAELKVRYDTLRLEVAAASDVLPALSEDQKEERADQHFDVGLEAYRQKDYLRASRHLDAAAAFDVSLGWLDNRKLRNVRAEVNDTLAGLRGAYETGKVAFQAGDYRTAQEKLQAVAQSEVSLGRDVEQDVRQMLARVEAELAQKKLADLKSIEDEARKLDARARKVANLYHTVEARMKAAEEAVEAGELERAKSLLQAAEDALREPDAPEAQVLVAQEQEVTQRLAQVELLAEEKAHREQVQRELHDLLAEARQMLEEDPLAAERKAREAEEMAASEGVALTEEQQSIHAKVLQAVEARYGLQRRLAREQCAKLHQMSEECRGRGEFTKAIELLSLVRDASPQAAPAELREQAGGKIVAVRRQREEQKERAERILSMYERPRKLLTRGEVETALQMRDEILHQAEQAGLAGEALMGVLRADLKFVREDLTKAVQQASPDYDAMAEELLAEARDRMALALGEYFLANNSPELAEPHLKRLVEQGSERAAAWARERLDGLEEMKAQAEQQALLAVQDELQRVYDLAQEHHALVSGGDMTAARAVAQQLADARLELQVSKARHALQRGAWQRARKLLAEAAAEDATPAAVQKLYEPLESRLESVAAAAARLEAAQGALQDHQLEEASAQLVAARDEAPLPEPLAVELEILAVAMEPIREADARQEKLEALRSGALAEARSRLQEAEQRAAAWQEYHAGLRSLLAGQPREARETLAAVVAEPAGLLPAEEANARSIVTAFAEAEGPALARAEATLGQAQQLCAEAQYARAADVLDRLSGLAGYSMSPEVQQQARGLQSRIAEAEQQARELYARAVEARRSGDREAVRSLLQELKQDYSGTAAYKERL
ncbi:MAG: hypothetical protein PVJ27_02260 [Candidatus Brocadiaceae bacterium]